MRICIYPGNSPPYLAGHLRCRFAALLTVATPVSGRATVGRLAISSNELYISYSPSIEQRDGAARFTIPIHGAATHPLLRNSPSLSRGAESDRKVLNAAERRVRRGHAVRGADVRMSAGKA